ncbi:hypothetical protein ABIC37_004415 [Priestia megaterium]
MTGNLSRTVLRGAGARESACLPDLTKFVFAVKETKRDQIFTWSLPNYFSGLI